MTLSSFRGGNKYWSFSTFGAAFKQILTSDEPAEQEERSQWIPGHADAAEGVGVGGVILGFLSTGEAGERRQHQAKHPHHYQIDRDQVLPRTVMEIHWSCRMKGQQYVSQSTFS